MPGLITPLIICGGSGTRLWPISRASLPKQFLPLVGDYSTFQQTVLRVSDEGLFASPMIITHHDYHSLVDAQLRGLGVRGNILLEPERRGSGPAILAGAAWIAAHRHPEAAVLALAADHIIRDVEGFRQSCRIGVIPAQSGAIVTFGIVPDYPATGYGYIEPGQLLPSSAHAVSRFVEKPDAERARRYVREGYFWNSGNFLFRARTLLDEYRRCDGVTSDAVAEAVKKASINASLVSLDAAAFARAASRSIDCAVMEKTARAVVVPAMHDWSDIGSWDAMFKFLSADGADGEGSPLRTLTMRRGEAPMLAECLSQPEYWIVAGGAGIVIIAGETRRLQVNEFIYMPARAEYRIESRGESDLQIITVPAAIISSADG